MHQTKRREYITNIDSLAQQAKAAPSYVFDLILQFENNFKVMNSTRGILERLDAGEVILSRLKSKYK